MDGESGGEGRVWDELVPTGGGGGGVCVSFTKNTDVKSLQEGQCTALDPKNVWGVSCTAVIITACVSYVLC